MPLSAFDLYSIGIGPSSSHTVGPMRAAAMFADSLGTDLPRVGRVAVELFGSLGATGRGHGSEKAVMLGLEGEDPATLDVATSDARVEAVREDRSLWLGGTSRIAFDPRTDVCCTAAHHYPSTPTE